jgi:integrase
MGAKAEHSHEFIKSAIGLLSEPVAAKRITFSEAMNHYLNMRKKKTEGDRLKKEVSYCNRFMTSVGDHLLATDTAGMYLKQYRNELLATYKPSTAARMMSTPKAALSYAADTLCTDVFIPEIRVAGSTQHAERYTLTEAEMVQLIDLVTTPEYNIPDYVRLFYLVAVHAGAHMREVRQTLTSDLGEWSGGLSLRIRGTKTVSRERVTPILPEFVPYIQKYMPAGEGSLLMEAGEVTDPAIDKQLTKPMKTVAKQATVYSVRHGCRSLAIAYNVPDALQQSLMGWSTQGGGRKQDRYGLSGRAYEEQMIAKEDALARMLQMVTKMLASKSL